MILVKLLLVDDLVPGLHMLAVGRGLPIMFPR